MVAAYKEKHKASISEARKLLTIDKDSFKEVKQLMGQEIKEVWNEVQEKSSVSSSTPSASSSTPSTSVSSSSIVSGSKPPRRGALFK
jgi:hypothetical protein